MSKRHSSPAGPGGGAAGSSSLRPRARRLISIEGDDGDLSSTTSTSTSNNLREAVDSAFSGARRRSPAPAAHPLRGSSANRSSSQQQVHGAGARTFGLDIPTDKKHGKPSSLWASSWTSLQGVASTFLGNNAEPTTPLTAGDGGKKKGKHGRNYSLSVPEQPWGPSGDPASLLASGSQEDRLAKVQAEKRKRLLAGVGDEQRDALGRYKRRSSMDQTDSIPSPTHGDDALVYIHRVTPSDSLAGLSIRYNCSQVAVRKSNRLYPNDSIQLRKIAYLPVDACSVRGQKVPGPGQSNAELLAGVRDAAAKDVDGSAESNDYHIASPPASNGESHQMSRSSSAMEQNWTHDSWVLLPHSSAPVEIGRMPRRALGFFPPARRKSLTAVYSDDSPPGSVTSDQAPLNAAPALTASARTSPGRSFSPARRPPNRPSRSSSYSTKLNPHARFTAGFLKGPGGIGSLHSSIHGPPPDELNRFVAAHMPQLIIEGAEGGVGGLPPRAPLPSTGLGLAGPRLSFDRMSVASGGSASTGVEAVAGAVEGWMRKVGGKVKESLGTPEMRGRGRDGDLIELVEGWDLNGATVPPGTSGGDSWESEGHGVLDDAMPAESPAKGKMKGKASAREDEERLLRERFPPAGKIFDEQSKRS